MIEINPELKAKAEAQKARGTRRKATKEVLGDDKPDPVKFTAYLTEEMHDALKFRSVQEKTPATEIVRKAIEAYLQTPVNDPRKKPEKQRQSRRLDL